MTEPAAIQFSCIGCGAMNPIGAEFCEGCCYRFAGLEDGSILRAESGPVSIPPSYEPHLLDNAIRTPRDSTPETSGLDPVDVLQGFVYIMVGLCFLAKDFFRAYPNAGGVLGASIVSTVVALGGFGLAIVAIYLIANNIQKG